MVTKYFCDCGKEMDKAETPEGYDNLCTDCMEPKNKAILVCPKCDGIEGHIVMIEKLVPKNGHGVYKYEDEYAFQCKCGHIIEWEHFITDYEYVKYYRAQRRTNS